MKNFFACIVATLLITVSYSQPKFGLKGGLNLATARYINDDNTRARLGFYAGALAEIPVQNFFVRPEILYSSKGFGFSATNFSREGSLKLNYLSIPLLLGFRPLTNTVIMAGPELGYLNKAASRSNGITTDMTNFYRRFDIGFDLGVAYHFNSSSAIEARYNHGFKGLVNTVITDNSGNIIGREKQGPTGSFSLACTFFSDPLVSIPD